MFRRLSRGSIAAVALGLAMIISMGTPAMSAASLPKWTGTYNVYRSGIFSTQQTWTWCTAASVQMMLNIVKHTTDHSYAGQKRIISYEQAHDRYPVGIVGSDPQGEAAALRYFGAGDYQISKTKSFTAAVKAAARRMRLTGKPVGLLVAAGNHAWVMSGFSATSDPAVTTNFTVTAVYIEGPLYPKQINHLGYYDPPPNTRYTSSQFSHILTRYYDEYAPAYSIWQGTYVTINP